MKFNTVSIAVIVVMLTAIAVASYGFGYSSALKDNSVGLRAADAFTRALENELDNMARERKPNE